MLLTTDELHDLTGYKVAKLQIKWLRDRGWRFELNRLGQPRVDREYYRQQMGNQAAPVGQLDVEPNWAAM